MHAQLRQLNLVAARQSRSSRHPVLLVRADMGDGEGEASGLTTQSSSVVETMVQALVEKALAPE